MFWRRKRVSVEAAPPKPVLSVNWAWPDGNGFTQCSHEYYSVSTSIETFNPAKHASPSPEDHEQYAALLRERQRLIAEGHTGKSFRFVKSEPGSEHPNKKMRLTRGFFCVEVSYEALAELTPDNPIGTYNGP